MNLSPANSRAQLLLTMALLGLLLLFALTQSAPTEERAFDLTSPAPDGLLALRLWLKAMGYQSGEISGTTFVLPPTTALLFIPPTHFPYEPEEAAQLADWVANGGTAVIIGPQARDDELFTTFGVRPGEATPLLFTVHAQQPLLPTVDAMELSGAFAALDLSDAPAAVPFLVNGDKQVTAALQRHGDGTVWHLTLHHSFVNEQLHDPAQATLLLAILRTVAPGSAVGFDTYHLWGAASSEAVAARSVQEWLYGTTWGWGLLFVLAVSALVLFLQGWRLGPPLPAQAEVRRREAAEYVIAMANLARRARHRTVVAEHLKRRLKRSLGHRVQIDATLNDADFVQQFDARAADLSIPDQPQARDVQALLHRLDQAKSDQQLIEAVEAIDKLAERHTARLIH